MDKIVVLAIVVMCLDFIQESLSGTIKALCQQNKAMVINFISYYLIIIPMAYYLTFRFSNKAWFLDGDSPDFEKPGLGLIGIWMGFVIGMIH